MLTFLAFIHLSWQLDKKILKKVSKMCETHSLRNQLLRLSKSLYLATVHQKPIKIRQIQSKLIKLKLLDEIFGEMVQKINRAEAECSFSDLK